MENDFSFPKDIYAKYLATINGIRFTPREIDIIAFLSSGRSGKKTASFFSISPKTVETHTGNIMEKLKCNSRESIIDFIEKAGKTSLLKEYYLKSLAHAEFEKSLKRLLLSRQGGICTIVYRKDQNLNNSFVDHLIEHLKTAGVQASLQTMRDNLDYYKQMPKHSHNDYVIHVLPSKFEGVSLDSQDKNERSHPLSQKKTTPSHNVLFLFSEKETIREFPSEITSLNSIDLTQQKNYFYLVFEILNRIFPESSSIKAAFEEFKTKEELLNTFSAPLSPSFDKQAGKVNKHRKFKIRNFLNNRRRLLSLSLLIPSIGISVGILTFKGYFEEKKISHPQNLSIRSSLTLPPEVTLLRRDKILAQIKNALKEQEGIQTVFLVGIGGSGKTTLARLYAQQQKYPIIWEINAESRESLMHSFENLAFSLSHTEKEKRLLKGFKEIKQLDEREGRVISFVGEKLKIASNWLLIYDNVEKFNIAQKYFPHNLEMGNKGKIIVSTRDSHMNTNAPLTHNIHVDELSPDEKLDLFIKITSLESKISFSPGQKKDATEFLKFIPPFPLDVSTAAYYLKATNTSYKNYLEHLQESNNDFIDIQESVLGESSSYAKSRYQIITLPLKRLIETDKDFGALLLFVSLLDSTNIPRDLLDEFKNDIMVDKFIFCLKKYSLISSQASPLLPSLPTFSMHRSTQAISFIYLTKTFNIEKKHQLAIETSNTLMNYIGRVIEAEDFERMKILLPHCETLISHHKSVKAIPKETLSAALGCMYFYLGKYLEAKKVLSTSLNSLNSHEKKNHLWNVRALTYLGAVNISLGNHEAAKSALKQSINNYKNHLPTFYAGQAQTLRYLATAYRDSGDYETAKDFFEDSLKIYQTHLSDNYVGVARALGYVGDIYRELGKFEIAKEFLEQSFELHKERFPENELGIVWNLAHLGEVYGILGEYVKAKNILEKSLQICKEYLSKNHAYFPWISGCLGTAYSKLGNFEKAKDCLIMSASLFKKNFSENRIYYAWAIRHLGIVYGELKNYEKAINLLQESLKISEEEFGKDHIEMGLILQSLGHVYLLQDQVEPAQKHVEKALKILQQHKHPELHVSLESLADIYLKKSLDSKNKGDKLQEQKFREQAITFLHEALEVVKIHFRANSPFIMRIQSKINKLS